MLSGNCLNIVHSYFHIYKFNIVVLIIELISNTSFRVCHISLGYNFCGFIIIEFKGFFSRNLNFIISAVTSNFEISLLFFAMTRTKSLKSVGSFWPEAETHFCVCCASYDWPSDLQVLPLCSYFNTIKVIVVWISTSVIKCA